MLKFFSAGLVAAALVTGAGMASAQAMQGFGDRDQAHETDNRGPDRAHKDDGEKYGDRDRDQGAGFGRGGGDRDSVGAHERGDGNGGGQGGPMGPSR